MNWILRHPFWFAVLAISSIIIISISCVFLFTRPAIISAFNLSDKYNLGSAIGGLTAPVIGICSSMLLFFALLFQVGANRNQLASIEHQNQQTEIDAIFELQNSFLEEIRGFIYVRTFDQGPRHWVENLTGHKALSSFVEDFGSTAHFQIKLLDYPEASQIAQLIDSYYLIEAQITSARIIDRYKIMFMSSVNAYFNNYLKKNFIILDAV